MQPDGSIEFTGSHADIFGKGVHLTAREKAILLQVDMNIRALWTHPDGKLKARRNRPDMRQEFNDITDFAFSRIGVYTEEIRETGGFLSDPKKRGPMAKKIEVERPDFKAWIENQAVQACSGVGLTLEWIQDAWEQETMERCSRNKIRQALWRLGFRYIKRVKMYTGQIKLQKNKKYCLLNFINLAIFCYSKK